MIRFPKIVARISDTVATPGAIQAPVLVVEDDADLRDVIADVLEDHDIPVIAAANGKQALDRLVEDGIRPSVILLDMMMPVMDGWRFREAMLTHPELATIPVVVMTAHANACRVASEIGAVGSLAKPVNVVDLLREATRAVTPSPSA